MSAADETPRADCLALEILESIAAAGGSELPDGARAHLQTCDRCARLLDEMRDANRFLSRFTSRRANDLTSEPDPGTIRVAGYEVERLIAFGGQGAVYKARQRATGRTVAIKVPLGDALQRPSSRYRFQREIELTARLDHPGIVRVFGDCQLDDGRLACVMEFVEGEAIDRWADRVRAEGPESIRKTVEVMWHVADAIAYAHQHAVVHRDIKPSNVIVTADEQPHVLDFGLAKALGETGTSFVTHADAFVGTLAYAAPEQISRSREQTDIRTDVYALGLLLFRMLTGRLPHPTDGPTSEILRHIREVPPPRPSSLAPGVREELDAIVLKALAKETARRYASAGDLRDDLRAWLEGRVVRARLDSHWYLVRTTLRRHRWGVAAAVAVVLTLLLIGALGLQARELALRARLSDAVRDAQILESHRASLEEARSIARDNLEAGERIAWDALLEPEPILIENAIEGVGAAGPIRASPAYWALWEIYQRTPIVFTAPAKTGSLIAYDSTTGDLIVFDHDEREVQAWDWRAGVMRRSIGVPGREAPVGMQSGPESGAVILSSASEPPVIVNTRTMSVSTLGDAAGGSATILSSDRIATIVSTTGGAQEVRIWNTADSPASVVALHPLSALVRTVAMDASGQFFAMAAANGEVLIVDAHSGEIRLHRSPEERPRFVRVNSRGNDGEFILSGLSHVAVIDMIEDPTLGIDRSFEEAGFANEIRALIGATRSGRYAAISDRWRLGVGDKRRPITEGRYLPALSVSSAVLSADGRYVALTRRPSGRGAVLDLESPGVRRLPFPSQVTEAGAATIFDVSFADDNSTLIVGAMDGSIRRFDTRSGSPLPGPSEHEPGGIAVLTTLGGDIYAGTHDHGLRNAKLVRVRDGGATELVTGGERWFSGLEASPSGVLWALTGDGHLLRLDSETGKILRESRLDRHPENPTFRALARVAARDLLLVGPAGAGIVMLDEETLEPVGPPVATPPIREIEVSPVDPNLIVTAADDGMIRLWRFRSVGPPSLELVRSFGVHAGAIFDLAFSPDGRLIASGGGTPESRDVRLWDIESGHELAAFDLFELGVFCLEFSPDGRWLAAGGEVRLEHSEEGGQLYLIDLDAPNAAIAGNLKNQIARFGTEQGHEPSQAAALRDWCARVRAANVAGRQAASGEDASKKNPK